MAHWTTKTTGQVIAASHINDLQDAVDEKQALYGQLADLQEPFYIAHRGGANVYPENTLDAFRGVASAGASVVELDCHQLRDGALGVMHDFTLDRTTTSTGNTADQTSPSFRRLVTDAGAWFGGAWGDITGAPTLEDVLREFGGRLTLVLEPKSGHLGVIATVKRWGVEKSVLLSTFAWQDAKDAVAEGVPAAFMHPTDSADPVLVAGDGIPWVGVSTAATESYVNSLHAAGLKTFVYTLHRHVDRDLWLGRGVSAITSNDPIYLANTHRLTSDPFATKTYYHGHVAAQTDRGQFLGTNRWGWANAGLRFCLQGWACPLANASGSYSITFTMTVDAAGTDSTRWGSIAFCCPTDLLYNEGAGTGRNSYHLLMRQSGVLQIYKVTDGNAVAVTSQATAAIGTGGTATIKIDVTPTDITCTRTDVAPPNSFTISDTTYRGGYFHFGKHDFDTSGFRCSWSGVTIT